MNILLRRRIGASTPGRLINALAVAGCALILSACVAPAAQVGSLPTPNSALADAPTTGSPVQSSAASVTPRAKLQGVPVDIVGSVSVKSDPQAVADAAVSVLAAMSANTANAGRSVPIKVTSLTAVQASSLESVVPGAGAPDKGTVDDRVLWVVRAEGPFIGLRVPPGREPIKASAGYILVDDLTAKVVGMGMP